MVTSVCIQLVRARRRNRRLCTRTGWRSEWAELQPSGHRFLSLSLHSHFSLLCATGVRTDGALLQERITARPRRHRKLVHRPHTHTHTRTQTHSNTHARARPRAAAAAAAATPVMMPERWRNCPRASRSSRGAQCRCPWTPWWANSACPHWWSSAPVGKPAHNAS